MIIIKKIEKRWSNWLFFPTDFEFTAIYIYEYKSLGTTVIILTRISKLKKTNYAANILTSESNVMNGK